MLEAGKNIGNYILARKLGAGGFGEVWQAEKHTKLSVSNFALKFFRPKEEDKINLDKEKREIGIWQKVSGLPNVISIIEADQFEEYIYVVSEYADGGSLENQMSASGGKPFPLDQAITITLEILSGLNSLHQMSFVHRDVKPANILIRRGVYCLADFGISREMKAHSKTTQTAGTYEYMAPESFENKRVTLHSDIWAVGAIFQQLLTGGLPFPQTEIPPLIYAILHGEPVNLPDYISSGIRQVVTKALEKEPQNRYGSAAEMMSVLKYQQMLLNNPEWGSAAKSSRETLVLEDNFKTQRVAPTQISNTSEPRRITREPYNLPVTEKTHYSGNFELPPIPSINEANRKKSNRSLIMAIVGGGSLLVLLLAVAAVAFAFKDRVFSNNSVSNSSLDSTANSSPKPENTGTDKNANQDVKAEASTSLADVNKNSAKIESLPEVKPAVESTVVPAPKPTQEVVKRKESASKPKPTPTVGKLQRDREPDNKKKNSDCIFTGDC